MFSRRFYQKRVVWPIALRLEFKTSSYKPVFFTSTLFFLPSFPPPGALNFAMSLPSGVQASLVNSVDRVDSPSLVTTNSEVEEDEYESDEETSYEEGSLAESLSTTDVIDMSDGNLVGPDRLVDLANQMTEFAITTLQLSNNSLVDMEEEQKYNDDSHCNRGILAFAKALQSHTTITNLDLSQNNLGGKGQSGLVALAKAVESG